MVKVKTRVVVDIDIQSDDDKVYDEVNNNKDMIQNTLISKIRDAIGEDIKTDKYYAKASIKVKEFKITK